jgi:hypothetical protein
VSFTDAALGASSSTRAAAGRSLQLVGVAAAAVCKEDLGAGFCRIEVTTTGLVSSLLLLLGPSSGPPRLAVVSLEDRDKTTAPSGRRDTFGAAGVFGNRDAAALEDGGDACCCNEEEKSAALEAAALDTDFTGSTGTCCCCFTAISA